MPNAVVVIDYQNIHLTAHGKFCPDGLAKHESLIHPLHFANQVLHERALAGRRVGGDDDGTDSVALAHVAVFRGLPGNKQQPDFYRRNQAQKSEWTRDRRVDVNCRPLKYTYDRDGYWNQIKGKGGEAEPGRFVG